MCLPYVQALRHAPRSCPALPSQVYTPFSKTGGHNLAAFTTKGGLAYLFVLTAGDKQWGANEGKLRTMLESFRA